MSVKEKIHPLVENCADDSVLYTTLEVPEQSGGDKNWWEKLTEEEKKKTQASLNQLANGQTVTRENLRSRIWELSRYVRVKKSF